MFNIEIENHKPLRELVYQELKTLILEGKITPGTRLMEIDLAESLGVSRTPVREAIRQLEKEGLVIIEPRKGAYVSPISTSDIIEILEVRQNIEGLAARFAACRMSGDELEALRKASSDYDTAVDEGNTADMIKYDTKFHRLIADSSHNKILVHMVEQLQEFVLRFRYVYYDDFKRAGNVPKEHADILEAIASGDGEAARAAADFHIEKLKELIIAENS